MSYLDTFSQFGPSAPTVSVSGLIAKYMKWTALGGATVYAASNLPEIASAVMAYADHLMAVSGLDIGTMLANPSSIDPYTVGRGLTRAFWTVAADVKSSVGTNGVPALRGAIDETHQSGAVQQMMAQPIHLHGRL